MMINRQITLMVLAAVILLTQGAGAQGAETAAVDAFDAAINRGRVQMERGRKVWDIRLARGAALEALAAADGREQRAQAAALLESILLKLAATDPHSPEERLTLRLQAAGTYGLRGDFEAMERGIAETMAALDKSDPTEAMLDNLEGGAALTLPGSAAGTAPPEIVLTGRIQALWNAAVFYVHAREYEVARVLEAHKRRLHAAGAMPLNSTVCSYVESVPSGVVAWAESALVRDSARRVGGFYPSPRQNKEIDPSLQDVLSNRLLPASEKARLEDSGTAFYTVYDDTGWHLYLVTDRRGAQVDIFFSTSMRHIHPYRLRFRIPHGAPTAVGDIPFQVDSQRLGNLIGTAVTVPWESLHTRLPFSKGHDEPWGFTITLRADPVSITWGGTEREPGRWGRIAWTPPTPEQRLAIQRRLIGSAWGRAREELPAVTNIWSDPARGDTAFHNAAVEPLAARHAALGKRLEEIGNWSAAEVEAAYREVPGWMDLERHAAALHREALLRRFTENRSDGADRSDSNETAVPDPWAGKPVACHIVPALGSQPLTPETRPSPETKGDRLDLVGAAGEFVPASFVADPLRQVSRFTLEAGPLRRIDGGAGEIPADMVDIRVVKSWWQPGRAWYSYADDYTRRELMPDLLLHDDDLVRVDMENREHFVRVRTDRGPAYEWVSFHFPRAASQWGGDRMPLLPGGTRLDYIRQGVADAATLQPVSLTPGAARQFWVTLHVPEDAPGALYEGSVKLQADGAAAGEIKLRLRVLPFTLPDPRTAYDLERPFMVAMDGLGTLNGQLDAFGGDSNAAERRLRILFKNQREHNIYQYSALNIQSYNYYYRKDDPKGHKGELANVMADPEARAILARNLELVKEAGFRPPLIAAARACISQRTTVLRTRTNDYSKAEADAIYNGYLQAAKELLDLVEQKLGHRDVYFWGAGEPAREVVANQLEGFRALQALGIKVGSEGQPWMAEADEGVVDLINLGGAFFDRKYTDVWHKRGGRALWYAGPHPGAKDPDKARRVHGMVGYQAHYDGTKNNTWGDSWLDFHSQYGYHITMIYPTSDSVLDTLQWEGFRAGIDDVRYATKLRQAAAAAMAGGDAARVAAARQALEWLDAVDAGGADLDSLRLEMINWILRLSDD